MLGGAGSIHIASHLQLVDQPEFAYSWWCVRPFGYGFLSVKADQDIELGGTGQTST